LVYSERELYLIVKTQAVVRRWLEKRRYKRARILIIRVQSIVKAWLIGIKFLREAKKNAIKVRVVQELISIEKCYTKNLNIAYQDFYLPLVEKDIIPASDAQKLFNNIKELAEFHASLLVQLQESAKNVGLRTGDLGGVFLSRISSLTTLYYSYVVDFEHATETMSRHKSSNPKFQEFLKETECSKRTKGLDLESILIQPVQRIPRYELLLIEYLNNNHAQHPDNASVLDVVAKLKEVMKLINEQKRKSTNEEALRKIQEVVSGVNSSLLKSDFVMEGELTLVHSFMPDEKVYFYLFQHMILFAKDESAIGKLFHSKSYALKLHNVIKIKNIKEIKDSETNNAFHLYTTSDEYHLQAISERKALDWVSNIRKVILNYNDMRKKLAMWQQSAK